MHLYTNLELSIEDKLEFVDITDSILDFIRRAKGSYGSLSGILNVYTTHTTSAIRVNENEERLLSDWKDSLERLAPIVNHYRHDDIEKRDCPPDERINGHSHVKALYLGTSETIPVRCGELQLGRWQRVFFIDLDGGNRIRQVYLDLVGDTSSFYL